MSERIESNDMGRFSTVSRMTQITSRILMLLVTLGSAALAPFTKADTAPADVRIVIDISGSMKETDPSNLRSSGVNMLVEMLPEGSKAGVYLEALLASS